jgi:hypothetical protein
MMTGKLSSGDNFPLLDAEFQRMAAELAEALVRVEAVWADRFNPSWTIFIASPSIIFYEWSQSIIAGLVSGLATEPEPATGLRLLAGVCAVVLAAGVCLYRPPARAVVARRRQLH